MTVSQKSKKQNENDLLMIKIKQKLEIIDATLEIVLDNEIKIAFRANGKTNDEEQCRARVWNIWGTCNDDNASGERRQCSEHSQLHTYVIHKRNIMLCILKRTFA